MKLITKKHAFYCTITAVSVNLLKSPSP